VAGSVGVGIAVLEHAAGGTDAPTDMAVVVNIGIDDQHIAGSAACIAEAPAETVAWFAIRPLVSWTPPHVTETWRMMTLQPIALAAAMID
jgi:pyridoxal biosynthesis lyase PdxS